MTAPQQGEDRSESPWELLTRGHSLRTTPRKTRLFVQGDESTTVFVLERGWVQLIRYECTDRPVVVAIRGADWLLGAGAVILGVPYPLTAEALTETRTYSLQATVFRSRLSDNPALADCVHQMHCREIFDQLSRLCRLRCLPVEKRLLQLASELPSALGQPELTLSQEELGDLVFATRESVNRLLHKLEAQGLVVMRNGRIAVR
jgi:CRP-like cAMP-binding protein